jgi:hypothetical protein
VVGLIAPDTRVEVRVVRDRKERSIEVDGRWPGCGRRHRPPIANAGDAMAAAASVSSSRTAPEDMLSRWDLSGGVLVREVRPDSPAGAPGSCPATSSPWSAPRPYAAEAFDADVATSATSRSSPTSTTASRRWPTASSSTAAVSDREMQEQVLDSMDIERERGITIKAQSVTLDYQARDGQSTS